jgi:hypothetical protein
MTRHANRRTALLALTGPLVLLTGSAVWGAHRPAPSLGQTSVGTAVAEAATSVQK